MFRKFIVWLLRISKRPNPETIIDTGNKLIINVPTIQGEIKLNCHFEKSINYMDEIVIRELEQRTLVFLTKLQFAKLNQKILFSRVNHCKIVFVPNRWECETNKWWCDGHYGLIYQSDPDKRARVIMCAKYSGRKFKTYTDYTSWEHELGHLFGVFGKNHTIRTELYKEKIKNAMYV